MTKPTNCPVSDLDPFAPDFLEDPYHDALREAGPVVWLEKYDVCAMARYQQVRAALSDWETFCSSRGVGLTDFATEEPWRTPSIILEADPPLHTKTRGVLMSVLSKPALQPLSDDFKSTADKLVDDLVVKGEIDAVRDLAEAFPLSVFPDTIGLRKDGRENLLPYGDMAFNAFGPRNELFERSFANAQRVVQWITDQCQRQALVPGGIGERIYKIADDGKITEDEAALLVRSLLTAGLDTTIFGIGAVLYCFARFPDQWQVLRENPKLVRGAFEEALRFVSPVQTFMRTTTRAVDVEGVEISEGQKVLLFLASANRDPRQWEDPDRFDIGRRTLGHVGFGHGIHVCVGQMLARLEAQVLLTSLVERVERIELTGEPTWRLNNTLHGVDSLPVKLVA
ncbi:MAG: cytochrome P450 [Caldilineaceae bacterium SB0675_bin_29]|uniref:Cytochrome P450 n=1 Tax=Caldilineaceae bacterium SB0675_bin_29 TaxID=2605266 RepID=A0A6B1G0I6_9CHLR|nr:cytochrome P450 [Caldilineaceae bacterium SB0675_bin_29]